MKKLLLAITIVMSTLIGASPLLAQTDSDKKKDKKKNKEADCNITWNGKSMSSEEFEVMIESFTESMVESIERSIEIQENGSSFSFSIDTDELANLKGLEKMIESTVENMHFEIDLDEEDLEDSDLDGDLIDEIEDKYNSKVVALKAMHISIDGSDTFIKTKAELKDGRIITHYSEDYDSDDIQKTFRKRHRSSKPVE